MVDAHPELLDRRIRTAAFAFLRDQTAQHGEVLPWHILTQAFHVDGQRVPLMGQQGIFKPAALQDMPLSITTAAVAPGRERPYADGLDASGFLAYRYRGTDPQHPDNRGLRLAMKRGAPLIYMFGVTKGRYLPTWPVYVVGDDPGSLTFKVAIDDRQVGLLDQRLPADSVSEVRRSYITALTLRRVHQETFRQRVLRAYRESCSICRLRHVELLEAAHIIPDSDPRGEPIVQNGLALCKLHHAAFDRHILGIRPDLVVEIRRDILEETDGPMLRWGLQEMAGASLLVPKKAELRPRVDFLEERYELFRAAG